MNSNLKRVLSFKPLYAAYSVLLGFLTVCGEMYIYSKVEGINFKRLDFFSTPRLLIMLCAAILFYCVFTLIEAARGNAVADFVLKLLRSPFVPVLLVTVAFRIWYYSYFREAYWYDTTSYVNYPYNILEGQVDVFRTPLYPYFLKLVSFLFNVECEMYEIAGSVIKAQMIVSAFSAYLFYCTVKKLFSKKAVVVITTLLFSCCPMIISWEFCILTETLAVFMVTLFLWCLVCYLKNQSYAMAAVLGLLVFVMIMLRPAFVYLFAILGVFWIMKLILSRVELKQALVGLAALVISGALTLGYCALNYSQNNYFGISNVGTNINSLYMVIDCGITDNPDYPEISKFIEGALDNADYIEDFNYVVDVIEPVNGVYKQGDVSAYVKGCIERNSQLYFDYQLDKFVDALQYDITLQYAEYNDYEFVSIDNALMNAFFPINILTVLVLCLLAVVYTLYVFVRRKRVLWTVIGLCAFIFTHTAVSIIATMAEFERLIFLIIPAALLLAAWFSDTILCSVDRRRLTEQIVARSTDIIEHAPLAPSEIINEGDE